MNDNLSWTLAATCLVELQGSAALDQPDSLAALSEHSGRSSKVPSLGRGPERFANCVVVGD